MGGVRGAVFGAVALAAGGWSGTASAIVLQATYIGSIAEGSYDETNMFGSGTDIGGLDYRLGFIFDTATPAIRNTGKTFEQLYGGTSTGAPTPILSAWVTIGGHTEHVAGTFQGGTEALSAPGLYSTTDQTATDQFSSGGHQISRWINGWAFGTPETFPRRIYEPVGLAMLGNPPGIYGGGNFEFTDCVTTGSGCDSVGSTIGAFKPESVRIAPVPVPASLPLLGVGLAAIGFAASWRRRSVASVAG